MVLAIVRMRRSGRVRKQREFFKPAEPIPEDEDESEDSSPMMKPPKGRLQVTKRPGPARTAGRPRVSTGTVLSKLSVSSTSTKKAVSKGNIFLYEGTRCRLFDILASGGSTEAEVRNVVSMFEKNRIAAVAEIVNFVLLAGGAQKKWIGNRVELEGLEPEELDELLRDMINSMVSHECPVTPLLGPASKGGVSVRDRYAGIWMQFVENAHSPLTFGYSLGGSVDQSSNYSAGIEILDMVINVLIALSSNGIAPIRDAVTEAALCIGHNILGVITGIRAKRDIAARQLKAEEQKGRNSKLTPKYKSIQKQVTSHEQVWSWIEFNKSSRCLILCDLYII